VDIGVAVVVAMLTIGIAQAPAAVDILILHMSQAELHKHQLAEHTADITDSPKATLVHIGVVLVLVDTIMTPVVLVDWSFYN
jgi:hypothetical protein